MVLFLYFCRNHHTSNKLLQSEHTCTARNNRCTALHCTHTNTCTTLCCLQGALNKHNRTPPAVPVRGRKTSTDEDTPHSTPAPTNPFLLASTNPFIEHVPPVKPTSPVPPAIPPPPTRSRRSSAVPYDSNAPSRRASSVYLDTAPASRRSSTASTDQSAITHLEPTPPTQPTIILPNNYQRQSITNKRNTSLNGVTCHTDVASEPTAVVQVPPTVVEEKSECRGSMRQDSNVSSESVSQTSSPSYTTKTMETPLLLNHVRKVS